MNPASPAVTTTTPPPEKTNLILGLAPAAGDIGVALLENGRLVLAGRVPPCASVSDMLPASTQVSDAQRPIQPPQQLAQMLAAAGKTGTDIDAIALDTAVEDHNSLIQGILLAQALMPWIKHTGRFMPLHAAAVGDGLAQHEPPDAAVQIALAGQHVLSHGGETQAHAWGFCLPHHPLAQATEQTMNASHCPRWTTVVSALAALQRGEIVAFPTETVYGLGASVFSADAIQKIYHAKGRPADNPLIVHIAHLDQLKSLFPAYPHQAWLPAFLDHFWPGPLTVILPDPSPQVAANIHAGYRQTLAVRMPDHPLALQLIAACGPLAAPSANQSGRPSPTLARHVQMDLGKRIGGVLDGGACVHGIESTILDLSQESPVILREGPISREAMQAWIPHPIAQMSNRANACTTDLSAAPKAPGMKYHHYRPDIPLFCLSGNPHAIEQWLEERQQENRRIGWIAWQRQHLACLHVVAETYICGNFCTAPAERDLMVQFYAALWAMNRPASLDGLAIWVDGIQHRGLLEKLHKAASKQIVLR